MSRSLPWVLTGLIVLFSAIWLAWIGRLPICECGYVKLWHGDRISSENSQHLTDWYTPSHVIHGLIFYAILWGVAGRLTVAWRLTIATAVESFWEILENSEAVIERYRTATIALDYYGDSVINSVADIVAMWVGFFLARTLPVWLSVTLAIGAELFTTYMIRDGLALNVLMLLWPLDAVRVWQGAF